MHTHWSGRTRRCVSGFRASYLPVRIGSSQRCGRTRSADPQCRVMSGVDIEYGGAPGDWNVALESHT
eukprot:1335164-Rhodomonas_salina.1